MIELLLKLIDRLIDLKKYQAERLHKVFQDILRLAFLRVLDRVIILDAVIGQVASERLNGNQILFRDCAVNLARRATSDSWEAVWILQLFYEPGWRLLVPHGCSNIHRSWVERTLLLSAICMSAPRRWMILIAN
jgi:hypothetical protein